jgi:hypothetical protein
LHHRIIAPSDRLDQEAGDAWNVEDSLGDDKAADQKGCLDIRAPKTMRLHMSRPMKSAPSKCTPPGLASESRALVLVGSNAVIQPAKIAISTTLAEDVARPVIHFLRAANC